MTTTRSHSNDLVKSALEALKPTEILRVGGAGYKVLQVGRVELTLNRSFTPRTFVAVT